MYGDLETIKKQLLEHEQRLSKLEELYNNPATKPPKKVSLREFIVTKQPQDDLQKTLAIGYYLEVYCKKEFFTTKDIENGFVKAREKIPSNISDKIRQNREKDYMMKIDEESTKNVAVYCLTNNGRAFVEQDFVDG